MKSGWILASLVPFLFAVHSQADLVQIGGLVQELTKSTSCSRDAWGKNDESACRCCITKHKDSGDSSQDALVYCEQKKHCTKETIANIAAIEAIEEKPVPSKLLVDRVVSRAHLLPIVDLNESYLAEKKMPASGMLNAETAVYFLQEAAKGLYVSDFAEAKEEYFVTSYREQLAKGGDCIIALPQASQGETLQLFNIVLKAACSEDEFEKTIFILKEMKNPGEEVKNIEELRQSAVGRYLHENLIHTYDKDSNFGIALTHNNLIYTYKKKKHFMSLISTAPGTSLSDRLKSLPQVLKVLDEGLQREAKIANKKSFCAAGHSLGVFNREAMTPKGAIFGNVIAHGNLSLDKIFVDGDTDTNQFFVTLVDNQSMAASLKQGKPVSTDLLSVYSNGATKSELWNEVFFEPFINCYAHAFPSERTAEVKRELKKIFGSSGILSVIKSANQKNVEKIVDSITFKYYDDLMAVDEPVDDTESE